jgi:hypothetical protein
MLVDCADMGLRVVTVDPRTGGERWRAGLPVEPPLTDAVLLSAHPVVVHAVEEGSRAADFIISFSDGGQVRARIPRSGPDYDMPESDNRTWSARPVRQLTVWDDRLIAPISIPGEDKRTAVAAFSLETGAQLWRTDVNGDVTAVEPTTGGLVVSTKTLRLHELSPLDGTVTASVPVRGRWYLYEFDLRKVNGVYVIIRRDGAAHDPPVMMVG